MFHLQPEDEDADREVLVAETTRLEQVDLKTIDDFCEEQGIAHVGFLKMDTEGSDLDVLRGAENILRNQDVDIVQVEAGTNQQNRYHVHLEHFSRFLEERDYHLFGIYDQMNEWIAGGPNLRRVNPIFISGRVVKSNTAA